MINPVHVPVNIAPIDLPAAIGAPGAAGNTFQSVFADAIGHVQSVQQTADVSVDRFLSGENEEIHHVALVTQQSELAFEMFMGVRNKVVQAYQEVMRMQM